jgi:hypothetical protein
MNMDGKLLLALSQINGKIFPMSNGFLIHKRPLKFKSKLAEMNLASVAVARNTRNVVEGTLDRIVYI